MIAILLLPAVLVLTLTVGAAPGRVRFPPTTQTFACKLRSTRTTASARARRWPARRCRAAWEHDVLLVQRGRLFPRLAALPVRTPDGFVRATMRLEVGGLGHCPAVITLSLDDGTLVEAAAAGADRTLLVGPFLAAAIPGLPQGPQERRNVGR